MKIYNYDEKTFEYLYPSVADKDPVQSKIKGEFVPLVPKNATTIKPPKVGTNEVAIFENNKWVKKVDYRFTHKKVDSNLIVSDITEIGEMEGIIVDIEAAVQICKNPNLFKIQDGKLFKKTDEEIAAEQEQQEKQRIAQLKLTKREVFLGLYQAKGITPDIIKSKITDPLALIEFEYANDYFRGNPLIDEIGETLGFTSDQLDKFFEKNDYKCLLSEV